MTVFLTDVAEYAVNAVDGLRVSAVDAERVTGWALKPEGMCRDELGVPLDANARRGGAVDLAAVWRRLGNPVVSDPTGEVWELGAGADSRAAALSGLEAPDFCLPDLAGVSHTLSAYRGKKVFLTTWASW